MKLSGLKTSRKARERTVVLEAADDEDEAPSCTFDDDADASIERCWASEDDNYMAPQKINLTNATDGTSNHPLALASIGAVIVMAVMVAGGLLMREIKSKKKQERDGAAFAIARGAPVGAENTKHAKEQPHGHQKTGSALDPRVNALKLSLEKEAKEKEGLSEQNNFLKSALEERKATVQMFTSELQSRDEQLANFEQEQIKVKDELYNQIEALKIELQSQEKVQQENLNSMDGQCANLAGKVEKLMKELANREEQWDKFEKDAKAKEVDSKAQIEAIKKEYSAKEASQKDSITSKKNACVELQNQLESLSKEMKDSEVELSIFEEQREKWNNASDSMSRMLKEKREEIVGLTTRMELFMGELKSRKERVGSLEQKVLAKKELVESDLEELRISVKAQREEHENWSKKTAEIERLLGARQEEAQEFTTRVESLTKELESTSEKVLALETKVQDKAFVILANKESMEKTLRDEQNQRAHWTKQHAEMGRLLKARQDEFACLTARVEIFATELQARETIVENLESKVKDKEATVETQLVALKKDLGGKQAFRDTWSESTKEIHCLLDEKKDQCVGLSTRVELFHLELRKRGERVASLERIFTERSGIGAAALEPYCVQLNAHKADLDKWTNSTLEIKRLLQSRRDECVGLTTRLSLFNQKLCDYDGQVDELSKKVDAKLGSHTNDVVPLQNTLRKHQEERDSWESKTTDIGKQLEERQNQCVGLTTRLALFRQQAKYHEEQVLALEAKASDLHERFDLQIVPLRSELKAQREGLECWKESTVNVEKLLQQAENECVCLTGELKQHIAKLQGCQKEVATLQAKVEVKGDIVTAKKKHYLTEHQKDAQELNNWSSKTKDLEDLLVEKEGQIIGLTTRLALFELELVNRQTACSDFQTKFTTTKEEFENKILNLQNELQFQREQRDHCLEVTLNMNKSMKEVKEPCIGLTTRLSLFKKELEGREDRVKLLDTQVREKTEHALSMLEPLRKELQKQQDARDKWNDSTLDIFWMLKERQDQTVGLTTRLELFMSELQKKEEAVDAAESALRIVAVGLTQMDNLEGEIKAQEEQKRKWQDSTNEVADQLKQKEQQRSWDSDAKLEQDINSLSAKLELFSGEQKRREEKIKNLRSTSTNRRETLAAQKGPLEEKVRSLREDRDSWMEKTLNINRSLKDIQAECVGLSTRWELFKEELKKRKEITATLETKVREKEEHFSRMVHPYDKELHVQTDLRNKWLETIDKMERLLKKKESECINFTTQLETAIDELSSRKEQVACLEANVNDTKELAVSKIGALGKQLAIAEEDVSTWAASTQRVGQLLKDKRRECSNLQVRLQVFRRQVENQDNRIAKLESVFKTKQNEIGSQLGYLQNQLREQQAARDESVSTTLSINQEIKAKEIQCTIISVRLSLFRSELDNREKNVDALETKLSECEGMSEMRLGPVKAQLQTQKEELAKWSSNANDIEQLLKQRDGECVVLATRLTLFQSQLETIGASVQALEVRLQKRKEVAAMDMTPFKNALDAQRAKHDCWSESTKEIHNLLQDRKTQIIGLTTRLALFKMEVKQREELVSTFQAKLEEKEEAIDVMKLEPVRAELEVHQKEREKWAKTTSGIEDILKTKHSEIDGLATRLACFTMELQKREEACSVLAKKYNDNKALYGSQVQVLKSELAMQVEQRDKWRETTAEMRKQVADRKVQCTGLTTRVELFQKEIAGHDEAIAGLKSKLKDNDTAVAEVEDLKKDLSQQQDSKDAFNKALLETSQLLKEKKDQCAGLATRLVVFRQQLKERMDRLASTETRIKEKEDLCAVQIESLEADLLAQREQRDKWTSTTDELKTLLEEKESQCSIISAELELLTALKEA